MSLSTIISGLSLTNSVLDKVLSKRGTKIEKKILAVSLMRKAINNTEAHLIETNHMYTPNANLSNMWNDAFTAMISIDKELAWRLDSKSRFWSNPQKWLVEEIAMEAVPDLKELDEKCESILVELDKRN